MRGMTKTELADLIGVSKSRVSQLFSSTANPTLKLAARVCAALDVKNTFECRRKKSKNYWHFDCEYVERFPPPSRIGWNAVAAASMRSLSWDSKNDNYAGTKTREAA
ncbi:helix-turn-helix domain-containing protein [Notoacmeibacter sp. MSK16QG-6]|uniref:helix-turn-helix domain-containing protein n=1 Tax=Notoacmeibacter sp. MSK16QG-6 TaxID=2957982 RepID=UPI00353089AE